MMAFFVGQKVTRINKDEKWRQVFTGEAGDGPEWGEVCTVARCLVVLGFNAIELKDWPEPFVAANFRPVVEKKTDISIFTSMLSGSPVREDA